MTTQLSREPVLTVERVTQFLSNFIAQCIADNYKNTPVIATLQIAINLVGIKILLIRNSRKLPLLEQSAIEECSPFLCERLEETCLVILLNPRCQRRQRIRASGIHDISSLVVDPIQLIKAVKLLGIRVVTSFRRLEGETTRIAPS